MRRYHSVLVCLSILAVNGRGFAADIVKANNVDDLGAVTSWVGGILPGVSDIAVWDSTVTSANESTQGTTSTWGGIRIADPGGTVGIRLTASRTLTLQGNVDASASTQDVNFVVGSTGFLRFGSTNTAPQLSIAATKTMTFGVAVSNQANTKTLTLVGPGSFVFNGSAGSGGAMSFNVTSGASVAMNNSSNGWVAGTVSDGSLTLGNATAMSGKRVTLNAANGLNFASGVTTADFGGLEGSGGFSLVNAATSPVALTIGSNNNSYTFSGVIGGAGSLTKTGTGVQTLSGINTYTGNTDVSGGSLVLADNGGLRFLIGSSGVNNGISGTNATATIDGDFTFDLTGAGSTIGDAWPIVNVASLPTTFGSTFTAQSTLGAFSDLGGGLWEITENAATYQFSTSSGTLQVVPEPGAIAGIVAAAAGIATLAVRRHRRSARGRR